jgi:hypothetical protein
LRRVSPLVLALVGVSLLATACGGGSTPSAVANLGSSSAPTTVVGAAGNSGAAQTPEQLQALTAFAGCVRSHGLSNCPDPPYTGGELNKLGFTKQALERYESGACHADALAAGTVETPTELQQHLEQMLKIARCMQMNGIPNFPDPGSHGGLALPSSLNPATPRYAAAAKKCDAPPG